MKVRLFNANKIFKLDLPETVMGNFWIANDSTREKLVNIVGQNGRWVINSSYVSDVIQISRDNNDDSNYNYSRIPSSIIEDDQIYYIKLHKHNNEGLLFLMSESINETNIQHLINKADVGFSIGSSTENDIKINNELIAPKHLIFDYQNNSLFVRNVDTRYPAFINNEVLTDRFKPVKNGDLIFTLGLKIVIINKELFINKNSNEVDILSPNIIKAKEVENIMLEPEVEVFNDIYDEKDYFSRAPRLFNVIEKEKITIENPPDNQDKDNTPLVISMGTQLAMGLTMILSTMNSITSNNQGKPNKTATVISIVSAFLMLTSMLFMPLITKKYNKIRARDNEKNRQKKYQKYMNKKLQEISNIMTKQKQILFKHYLDTENCEKIIYTRAERLWERTPNDDDFLDIKLGNGNVDAKIDLMYDEERFRMEEDNLLNILHSVTEKSRVMSNTPIGVSLSKNKVVGLISKNNKESIIEYFKYLLLQLLTFHSYEDLKIVFLVDDDKYNNWEFVKMLPYIWDNEKNVRFFADNAKDRSELDSYLNEVFKERKLFEFKNVKEDEYNETYKFFSPYYLIITDDFRKYENIPIIHNIISSEYNYGFGIFCISNDFMQLPKECELFINIDGPNGIVFDKEISSKNQQAFEIEKNYKNIDFDSITKRLANIPIRMKDAKNALLPNSLTFLQMYGVGLIEQLNIDKRWKENDSVLSLSAPIGVDGYENSIFLDIHEKAHGPHGLVAGSTGSGKSEFLITYILSLAINFSPNDIGFLLIDYKGGGLAKAFEKEGMRLPHLLGTITNIDSGSLHRSLLSIQSELKRREKIFADSLNIVDEGTMDIYKYQRLYHEGVVKEAIPHLLIIADEFAELKQQQPEFMKELVSVSRIGRSLGVHLILATQKPAGIVDQQILSNTNFETCLKVQTRADSVDVIGIPDACNIKQSGQFYLKVGSNECIIGQSGWSGNQYIPKETTNKTINKTVKIINNVGKSIKEITDIIEKNEPTVALGQESVNIVRYIMETAKRQNYVDKQLWLDPIPEDIFLNYVKQKYQIKDIPSLLKATIGEYDDPYNQRQDALQIDLTNKSNVAIYGNSESGKESLATLILYDLITSHTPNEVQFYIADFGSKVFKMFSDVPHVGDVVFSEEQEKISRLFDVLNDEIEKRVNLLADYNGDYNLYIKTNGPQLPSIVLIINNYDSLCDNYDDDFDETISSICREGPKVGIKVIVICSNNNTLKFRIRQNFPEKIVLQMNKDDDYTSIFEAQTSIRPLPRFGSGLCEIDKKFFQFQTARICKPADFNACIKDTSNKLNQLYNVKAKHIPTLPEIVTLQDVKPGLKSINDIPIGLKNEDLSILGYDFMAELITPIIARNIESNFAFIENVIEEFYKFKGLKVIIYDAEKKLNTERSIVRDWNSFIENVNLATSDKKISRIIIILINPDRILNGLSDNDQFNVFINQVIKYKKGRILLCESVNKLKNRIYEDWFKSNVNQEKGIWLGNGLVDQFILTIDGKNSIELNRCGMSFGFAVKNGIPIKAKLLGLDGNIE